MNLDRRLGLPYQYAFDWLSVSLYHNKGLIACWVRSPWQHLELSQRLPHSRFLSNPALSTHRTAALFERSEDELVDSEAHTWAAAGIVEPDRSARESVRTLMASVATNGQVFMIVHGILGRFISENRHFNGNSRVFSVPDAEQLAAETGFRVTERFGVHSVQAIIHHYLSELYLRAGRRDKRDRRHFMMRRDMLVSAAAPNLSALVCLKMEHAV